MNYKSKLNFKIRKKYFYYICLLCEYQYIIEFKMSQTYSEFFLKNKRDKFKIRWYWIIMQQKIFLSWLLLWSDYLEIPLPESRCKWGRMSETIIWILLNSKCEVERERRLSRRWWFPHVDPEASPWSSFTLSFSVVGVWVDLLGAPPLYNPHSRYPWGGCRCASHNFGSSLFD